MSAYAGAVILTLLLLPIAVHYPMAGHSAMFMTTLGSLAGLVLGVLLSDIFRRFAACAIILRTILALIAVVLWIGLLLLLDNMPYLATNGWILIPIAAPLWAAGLSEMAFKRRRSGTFRHQPN
jgi:hypothetical protein